MDCGDEPAPTMDSSMWLQNALTPKSKRRGSWFTSTPHKVVMPATAAPEDDLPMLKLTHFTKKVMICFEKVKLGASKTCKLCVENPFDYPQELVTEKFPHKKGFTMPEDRWDFDEMETRILPITWTPSEAGNVRELVTFKCEGAFRLQVILLGTADEKPKGRPRRGTFLFKKTNGNVRKAPGKVANRPKQGSPTSSEIYQQPRPIQTSTAIKQLRPAQQKLRTNVGKENIPRQKDTMLKDVLKPNKKKLVNLTKVKSPKRSPLQERTSPFQSMDTSLAEITNGIEAGSGEPTKRDTLSVCEGMSPLLQTSLVFFGDEDTSGIPDISEVFNDSIEVHLTGPDPSETVTKSRMSDVKRLSEEAQVTIIKGRAPSMTPPMRNQSRRALFGSTELEESRTDANLIENETITENQHEASVNNTTVFKSTKESQSTERSDPGDAKHVLTDEIKTHCGDTQDTETPNSEMAHTETIPDETDASVSSSVVSSPSPTIEADLFPVHESVVTKRLKGNGKRKSDPKKPETVSHKKQKTQLVSAAKKPVTRPRPLSTTRASQQAANTTKKPTAKIEPSNRGMTRTMMLRRAAARAKTAQVSKPKPTKAKRPVKGVPMAKLNLVKPNKTALPRHPMPFAAKNMFYDERWMEKQEQGFTRWLNYVLTPDDLPSGPSCKTTKIDAGALFVEASNQVTVALAPSNEDLSLRAYTARRKLNRLRRSACILFQSEPVVRVIQKVEYEVERGGLKIRTDRKIHADYGIKQKVLNMFLSYNPLWLRIGLETVFGEILPIQSNTDLLGLSRFVVQRLLWNPDIAQKYAHPTVPGLYGQGYEHTLCQFTLKKFLLLVFFLDRAKLTRLIDHNPCLFCKDAEYKSSRSLLLEFSREYLQGEGDVTKHLSYYGYVVTHTQTALDEFDFAVSKLSTDLRCGVRMARVVELLTKNWSLSKELRVPAISRLQKIHNTDVALKALKEHGIDVEGGGVNTRAIVDGHREKTLQLLWRIIFYFQVEVMLNEEQIREEIAFLKKNLKLQHDLTALAGTEDMLGLPRDRRQSIEPNVYFKSKRLSLLLQWCRSVCHFYGLKVENFTVSFSDGRALCYLVHYYHPSLLPLDAIRQETTQTQYQKADSPSKSDADDSFDGTWTGSYSPSTGKPGEYERLLANERHNYKMLYEKVKELGGIPMMIKSNEMSNTIPDEKVVIVYVSYLCARLLDLRTETRAARKIQMVWRAYQLRHKQAQRQIQISAVTKIQGAVRDFLSRRRNARIMTTVIRMQALLRGKLARRQAERLRHAQQYKQQHEAAVVIQSQVKGFIQKRRFQHLKSSTLALQSLIRGYLARQHIKEQNQAAVTIQSRYQAWKAMQQDRSQYISLKAAAITLQSIYRGHAARKEACRERAAIKIQSQWRGYHCRKEYAHQKQSAITIQAWFRMTLVRQEYLEIQRATLTLQQHIRSYLTHKQQKKAATMMQALVRGYLARQHVKELNRCAVCIQRNFRAYIVQKHYRQTRIAAHTIQTYWRATMAARHQTREYQITKGAAITIQAWVRGCLIRHWMRKMSCAAVCIQSQFRSYIMQKHYKEKKYAAEIIQRHWRATLVARRVTRQYQISRGACITMQAAVRGFLVRQHVRKMHRAATCIQSNYRSHRDYTRYQDMKQSAKVLQMYWRSALKTKRQVRQYQISRGACVTIQSVARGFLVRQQVKKMNSSAVLIQSAFRAYIEKKHYQEKRCATQTVQMYWRATLAARDETRRYQICRGACITMQAAVRGFLVRQHVRKMHRAATCIQSNYRSHRESTYYQTLKRSTIIVQTHWRSVLKTKQQTKQYQITRSAVITIQSCVRRFIVRQQLKKQTTAAICIQANYRAHLALEAYQQTRQATVVLQKYWKATLLAKKQRDDYQVTLDACITIQAYGRGFLIRKRMQTMNSAAVCLQANYRAHSAAKKYQMMKKATDTLQTYWRATLLARNQVMHYQMSRGACITIQAWVRGVLVRQHLHTRQVAATCIQSCFRGFQARMQYRNLKKATLSIQVYWRAELVAREQQRNYAQLKRSAITIQSVFRGRQARRCARMERSARTIQATYRMHVARRLYLRQKQSAVIIQAQFRAHLAQTAYQTMRSSAIVIQQYYRGLMKTREANAQFTHTRDSIIKIQSTFRMFVTRQAYLEKRMAAITIQTKYRSYKAHTEYRRQKRAAIVIQKYYRGVVITRQIKLNFEIIRASAVKIQSYYRMHVQRKQYLSLQHAATVVQAYARGKAAYLDYNRMKKAAIVIQTRYRATVVARQQRLSYQYTRGAVITIQSFVRGCLVRNHQWRVEQAVKVLQIRWRATLLSRNTQQEFQAKRNACVTLQAATRGFLLRCRVNRMNMAATCVQANYRAYRDCCTYKKTRMAAICLQRYWRATLLMKREVREYKIALASCVTIQSVVRGFLVRQHLRKMNLAATYIQKNYRSHCDYKHYQAMRQSAMVLQSYWRATVLSRQHCKNFQVCRGAAITIQAWVRGCLLRQQMRKMNSAAVCIQSCFRAYIGQKHYQQKRCATQIIQMYWRAKLSAREETRQYQICRGACITMQAVVRGFLVRQHVGKMHHAATCIQSNYRCHRDSTHYQTLKRTTIILQTHWRSALKTKQQVRQYHITRGACVMIQSVARGFLVRQQVKKMNSSAVLIQSTFRAYIGKKHYQEKRCATQTVQMYWRATLAAREETRRYQICRGACITMQAVVRGFLVRQHVRKMHSAATFIQSNYRCHRESTHYQTLKRATIVLQTHWRSALKTKHQVRQYQISRGACVTIQSMVRGFLVRQHIKKMSSSAVLIQSTFRAYIGKKHYQEKRLAAQTVQMYWRATLAARDETRRYQICRGACITMQAVVRGFLVRQHVRKMHRAATCIQSNYRSQRDSTHYQTLKRATIILQTHWRSALKTKHQVRQYQISRGACVTIQSVVRGFLVRQHIKQMRSAATCIQTNFRSYHACKKYQILRQSTAVLQTYWRATLLAKQQRQQFRVTRAAVITIQSWARGCRVRQDVTRMNAAATCIQSNFRAHRDLMSYGKMRLSAAVIQQYWRAKLSARKQQIQYQISRGACITIQAWVRGIIARRHVQQMHVAATCIQSRFRGCQSRRRYQSLKNAAIVMQSHWRAVLFRRMCQERFTEMRNAAITIQAVFRGRQGRLCARRERSARAIQAVCRMHIARQTYVKQKQSAIIIQAKYRAHTARKAYQAMRCSAIIIQQYYRGLIKTREANAQFTNTRDSIIKMQSTFRMFIKRRSFLAMRTAAIRIQTQYRSYTVRNQYKMQREAAIAIQRYYRSVLTMRLVKANFERSRKSAITIQSCYRMHVQRKQYLSLQHAVSVVQACARGKAAYLDYNRMKKAAIVIQIRYRATLVARQQQLIYQHTQHAIVRIQSVYRGLQARTLVRQMRAAVTIQAMYRGYMQRQRYQSLRKSAIVLQAVVRGMKAREIFAEKRHRWNAAVCIQRTYRAFTARKEMEALRKARLVHVHRFTAAAYHHLCAIKLQRCYRNHLIMERLRERLNSIVTVQRWWRAKLQRLRFTKLQRGTVLLQRAVRRHQAARNAAAVTLQSYARVWLARQYVRKMKRSSLKIQCLWRGYRVRAASKSKKLASIRARCIAANAAATEEKKLCNMTTTALDYLLQYKNLSYILEALMNLDIVTRLSATCCERLVEGQAVPVIYTLIRSCNRSQPCKEVIKYCVSILLNLVKYPKTSQAVFDVPESIPTILDLMQIYREKGTLIFCQTCVLLGTLSHDPERAKAIHNMPKITDKIKSIHRLAERKHKMDSKRIDTRKRINSASNYLNSSRMNDSVVSAATKHPRRVQPEWVLGRGKLRDIQDPMKAVTFLMDTLRLLKK